MVLPPRRLFLLQEPGLEKGGERGEDEVFTMGLKFAVDTWFVLMS